MTVDQEQNTKVLAGCRRTLLHMRRAEAVCTVHASNGSIFLRKMTSWPPSWKCGGK